MDELLKLPISWYFMPICLRNEIRFESFNCCIWFRYHSNQMILTFDSRDLKAWWFCKLSYLLLDPGRLTFGSVSNRGERHFFLFYFCCVCVCVWVGWGVAAMRVWVTHRWQQKWNVWNYISSRLLSSADYVHWSVCCLFWCLKKSEINNFLGTDWKHTIFREKCNPEGYISSTVRIPCKRNDYILCLFYLILLLVKNMKSKLSFLLQMIWMGKRVLTLFLLLSFVDSVLEGEETQLS